MSPKSSRIPWAIAFSLIMLFWTLWAFVGAQFSGSSSTQVLALVFPVTIWLFGLTLLWLLTRTARPRCPRCSREVKPGRAVCKCGYDLARKPKSFAPG